MFSWKTLEEAEKCKQKLKEQISAVEEEPEEESTNSPISSAIELSSLYEGDTPESEKFEKIMSELERLNRRVAQIEQQKNSFEWHQPDEYHGGAVSAQKKSEDYEPGKRISFDAGDLYEEDEE